MDAETSRHDDLSQRSRTFQTGFTTDIIGMAGQLNAACSPIPWCADHLLDGWLQEKNHEQIWSKRSRRLDEGQAPRALDKEFLRVWLMERGFSGDGEAPTLPDEVRCELAERYLELYRVLVGEELKLHPGPVLERIAKNLQQYAAV